MDFVRDNPGEPVPEETFTHEWTLTANVVTMETTAFQKLPGVRPQGHWGRVQIPPCLQGHPRNMCKTDEKFLCTGNHPLPSPNTPSHQLVSSS